uniref:Uncharacterized protein n=1 Tax=Rhizophora mucronata TaxID=61149 RepID=A0A2P2ND86_RHIMU
MKCSHKGTTDFCGAGTSGFQFQSQPSYTRAHLGTFLQFLTPSLSLVG